MQYPGSKLSLKNELVPIISYKAKHLPFYDFFCGSGNVVAYMPNKERYANDLDHEIISLLKETTAGERFPDYISKDTYDDVQLNPKKYSPAMRAFIAYGCGFGGKWFGGYAKCARNISYAQNASRSLIKIKPFLQGVKLSSLDYRQLKYKKGSLLYFDPPYNEKNTMYRISGFDVKAFWDYVAKIKGSLVYISSYHAPKDFYEIWRKTKQTIHNNRLGGSFAVEKLFVNKETFNYITSNKTTL